MVFHAAAYTKVDLAEDEGRDINWQVNANGTKNVADAAKLVQANWWLCQPIMCLTGKV